MQPSLFWVNSLALQFSFNVFCFLQIAWMAARCSRGHQVDERADQESLSLFHEKSQEEARKSSFSQVWGLADNLQFLEMSEHWEGHIKLPYNWCHKNGELRDFDLRPTHAYTEFFFSFGLAHPHGYPYVGWPRGITLVLWAPHKKMSPFLLWSPFLFRMVWVWMCLDNNAGTSVIHSIFFLKNYSQEHFASLSSGHILSLPLP